SCTHPASAGARRSSAVARSARTSGSAFSWITSDAEVWRMNMNTRPSPAPQRAMKSRTSFVMSKKPCPRVSTTSVAALINSGAIAVIAESRFMTLFLLRHLSAGLQEFLWERGRGAAQRGSAFPLQVTLDIHRHLDETSEHPLHDGHDPLDFGVIGRRVIWPARPGRWCWRRGHWRRPRQNLWRGGQRRL